MLLRVPMKVIDPHGRVQCDDCEELGKPPGGVKTSVTISKVTKSFERPDGWAVAQDGALLCSVCALKQQITRKARNRSAAKSTRSATDTSLYGEAPSSWTVTAGADGNSRKRIST